ncbi:MAG: CbiX/SirB N-terminal domain-containing protein [Stagnimonas sp.]|nr:CbiX/SirB N-terminal domain-containing protein [Stagnimonas sp.]
MSAFFRLLARRFMGSLLFVGFLTSGPALAAPPSAHADHEVGFLVAAPDRGFMGNEEIRDLFDAFAKKHNASLLHVTDARTQRSAQAALQLLAKRGAKKVVILPLFYSIDEARYAALLTALDGKQALPLEWAQPFGASYFAVEALADRLRALPPAQDRRLVVVGTGASDEASVARISAQLHRIAEHASRGLGFKRIATAVWPEPRTAKEEDLRNQAQAALKETAGAVVVQLHLGRKLDSMMAFSSTVKRALPADAQLLAEESLTPLVLTWMQREANRRLPLTASQVGVVIAAHGSDWHWNETMRTALHSLETRYKVEYAFSMADPPILERAVRRLDERGVRAIVIVRVFGMRDSFKRDIEQLIGHDIEADALRTGERHEHADADSGHGDHGLGSGPAARIRSAAVLTSAGGVDDHPLFAKALVARAKELSRDPGQETVILTAHGTSGDKRNAQWIALLESIAGKMRENGGAAFREIRVATWREDWPDKSEPWVARVRGWVEQAGRDGSVIVIPARTNGTGPEAKLLSGLNYRLGAGFAPHPLFARWVDEQVIEGLDSRLSPGPSRKGEATRAHHH